MNQVIEQSGDAGLDMVGNEHADALYRAAEVRELDRLAIEEHQIPGIRLMSRAARAAFDVIVAQWPNVRSLLVCCGTGNNGGDGFIVAALAQQRGIATRICQIGDVARIVGDAATAREEAMAAGVDCVNPAQLVAALAEADVVVDALLGTGLTGPVREAYANAIVAINESGRPALAIDIPSGLCADSGAELGVTINAQHTVSFIGNKRGLFTASGPARTGTVHFADLGVPADIYVRQAAGCRRLQLNRLHQLLPPRSILAHKGDCGHLLAIGGDAGTAGAVSMAAEAAARVGAGLVSVATRYEHVAIIVARTPEVMAHGINSGNELAELLDRPGVFAIGPGLGQGGWAEQLLQTLDGAHGIRVLDADALNMLSMGPAYMKLQRDDWILTPHPGEAARLLDTDTASIQADRFAAATALQKRYGGVVVLKGPGTIIVDEKTAFLSTYGCPGMASGGMGDVLTGVIAGLCAQGLSAVQAACYGVCLHGAAAELAAAEGGERGTLASDLYPHLRTLVNRV